MKLLTPKFEPEIPTTPASTGCVNIVVSVMTIAVRMLDLEGGF